jgi:hypothetical protein
VSIRAGSHPIPSPKSQVTWGQPMQSQLLRAWKLGLTTSHMVPSPNSRLWHGCLHGNAFWRLGLGLVLRFGSSKKLDPTLNRPMLGSHLHSAWPCPSHAFFFFWGAQIENSIARETQNTTNPAETSHTSFTIRTCVGTLPCWGPVWQYSVKITNIYIDITFITPKLIDGVPSHATWA